MLHLQDSLRRTLEDRRSTKCEARQTMNVIGMPNSLFNRIDMAVQTRGYRFIERSKLRLHA